MAVVASRRRRKRAPVRSAGRPSVVVLWGCPATADGRDVRVSGVYEVVEYHACEPAAYCWSACVDLVPVGTPDDDWEDRVVTVDAAVFEEQTNPRAFGEQLRQERELELAQEADELEQRLREAS